MSGFSIRVRFKLYVSSNHKAFFFLLFCQSCVLQIWGSEAQPAIGIVIEQAAIPEYLLRNILQPTCDYAA